MPHPLLRTTVSVVSSKSGISLKYSIFTCWELLIPHFFLNIFLV